VSVVLSTPDKFLAAGSRALLPTASPEIQVVDVEQAEVRGLTRKRAWTDMDCRVGFGDIYTRLGHLPTTRQVPPAHAKRYGPECQPAEWAVWSNLLQHQTLQTL
jgi:hypothetical protein